MNPLVETSGDAAPSGGARTMDIDDIKTAIKNLPTDDRRNVALYILELEKEHVQNTYGPQIVEDVESVSKVVQEAIDKLKKYVNKS
jgi:hypothetical protein